MSLFLLDSHIGFHLIKRTIQETNKKRKLENEDELSDSSFFIVKEYLFKDNKEALKNIQEITNSQLPSSLKSLLEENKEEISVPDKNLKQILENVYPKICINLSEYKEIKKFFYKEKETDLKKITYISHKMVANKMAEDINRQDLMIIHAIKIIDDLEKDINLHSMKLREWYGLHFPELSNLIPDNKKYLKSVLIIKNKEDLKENDLIFLGKEVENQIIEISKISMGSDIQKEDLKEIINDVNSTLEMIEYKIQLSSYLEEKMKIIAPNLFNLIGVMGARLISKAGSLINLAKLPASTVQILGAEKALFSALKSKKGTPKYGFIFHSSFISKASPNLKGKIARMLGCKLSLCSRIDAFSENRKGDFGIKASDDLQKKIEKLSENTSKSKNKQKKKTISIIQ